MNATGPPPAMWRHIVRAIFLTALAITLIQFQYSFETWLSSALGIPDYLTRPWSWSEPIPVLIDEMFLILFTIGGYLGIFILVAIELKPLVRRLLN
jgi:hypothetical protein